MSRTFLACFREEEYEDENTSSHRHSREAGVPKAPVWRNQQGTSLNFGRPILLPRAGTLPHVFEHADILFQNLLGVESQIAPIG
jgi:hypothetical protein